MLYKLILGPLELLFDVIYDWAMQLIHNPGLSIIFLSLAINLLVLPLYKRADAVQEEERQTAKRLKPGIDHIKKVFKGDERVMILQTYYRQNNYRPYYALKGTLSLLLEIPFFIAAYNYLSHCTLIQGVSFGPIADLGAPDGLLKIGGTAINLLPILMTLINIISGAIYTKGMPLKSKIQLYGMALIFLVLLYDSPAGLVFYWTLNNLFSLGKNIVWKIRPPKVKPEKEIDPAKVKTAKSIFIGACLTLTVLLGVLIPTAIIKSSPGEFVDAAAAANPLRYVLHTLLLAAGTFLIWFRVYYQLARKSSRPKYALAAAVLALCAVINFMFFGKEYGNLSSILRYDLPLGIKVSDALLNAGVLVLAATAAWLLWKKKDKILSVVCIAAAIAIACMAGMNAVEINGKYKELEKAAASQVSDEKPTFSLDKKGKNVVVLMMDRAINGLVPYIFEEIPELKDKYTGFTYYPNTLSFGGHTNVASPALFGGYDYTPEEIQKRDDVYLEDKQNESLKIMPVNFMNSGFEVTVNDPTYANYYWTPDLSIYDDYPAIRRFNTEGAFTENKQAIREKQEHLRTRNLFCYSLMRSNPVALHPLLYDTGRYNEAATLKKSGQAETADTDTTPAEETAPNEDAEQGENTEQSEDAAQTEDTDQAGNEETETDAEETEEDSWSDEEGQEREDGGDDGEVDYRLEPYWALKNLSFMTQVTDEGKNTFLMMCNNLTHEIFNIQGPAYDPTIEDPASTWDEEHQTRTSWDGKEIPMDTGWRQAHYSCNACAFIVIGQWLDYLKEQGVYDNTRIIIVADHGNNLGYFDLQLQEGECPQWLDMMMYNPLLFVKDFGETGELKINHDFMTNADTPYLAFKGLVENPENPFLGTPMTDEAKNAEEFHIMETNWHTDENDGTTFEDPQILILKNKNVLDRNNWSIAE